MAVSVASSSLIEFEAGDTDVSNDELPPFLNAPPVEQQKAVRRDRADRAKLKHEYGKFFDEVVEILARADPLALVRGGAPRDEYQPEARTTLPRLRTCSSARDVRDVIDDEFARWFGEYYRSPSGYRVAASEIWEAWQRSGLAG